MNDLVVNINKDLTFAIERIKFIGFGVTWWRRNMFDYGHIGINLPFFSIFLEWSPDWAAFNERFHRE